MVSSVLMRNGSYELVVAPDDYPGLKYRGRYVYEHHLVWWRRTGELVPSGFILHHKNERKRDNRYTNLELRPRGEHTAEHHRFDPEEWLCAWCGKTFFLKLSVRRSRLKQSRSGRLFCSRSCGTRSQFNSQECRPKAGQRSLKP